MKIYTYDCTLPWLEDCLHRTSTSTRKAFIILYVVCGVRSLNLAELTGRGTRAGESKRALAPGNSPKIRSAEQLPQHVLLAREHAQISCKNYF